MGNRAERAHDRIGHTRWQLPAVIIALSVTLATAIALGFQPTAEGWSFTVGATCDESGDSNELLYCIYLVEPRFGGFKADIHYPNGISVWLTGDDSTDVTLARILEAVDRLWPREDASADRLHADYTLGQLRTWFDTIVADPPESMTGVDLDESTNWLAVFTPDLVDSTVNAVKDHLSDLGVPANALRVEERAVLTIPTPPAAPVRGATGRTRRSVPAGASPISEQRLDQGLNPFVGGGQILWDSIFCSAGFPVAFINPDGDYQRGFVTAGHCGDVDAEYFVPDANAPSNPKIGTSVSSVYSQNIDAQHVLKDGRPTWVYW